MWNILRLIFAGSINAALVVTLSGCMNSDVELCLSRADRESKIMRAAIENALQSVNVISITEYNGCDSANNGAWIGVVVKSESNIDGLRRLFAKDGWTSEAVDDLRGCDYSSCDADMAKMVENRAIGITLVSPEGRSAKGKDLEFVILVESIDACWTDEGYTCD